MTIRISQVKNEVQANNIPNGTYFMGSMNGYGLHSLWAKDCLGNFISIDYAITLNKTDAEGEVVKNYQPVRNMVLHTEPRLIRIKDIPEGTTFTGSLYDSDGAQTCDRYKGTFLKLSKGELLLFKDASNVSNWGSYGKDNLIRDYKVVDLEIEVEI